ncbi:NUDIX domain-containing protein [Mobilicoccus pelagius]|uniref:Nudix hydrolase domain-containing protein n=1 Tax=Mobilicoccus pelagius NBRC 104925 TaxID=1089455 RepID=H5UTD0_9MICO|nr:NUDIX domain-containing protein [Mobilicoccus pelagius]GAB48988.1 hypothetical protein MOPEL_094_00050 [Mobilicoccus pelagius NBRC 104925]
MPRRSAGVLPYRLDGDDVLVFLAHPGGPFWARKDEGCWSVVKGEYDPDAEDPRAAAAREFTEETGVPAPEGEWLDLGEVRQSSSKIVRAYAVAASAELAYVSSNLIDVEWPPRSGRTLEVPEVDRAEWMTLERAHPRLLAGQRDLLDRLRTALGRA